MSLRPLFLTVLILCFSTAALAASDPVNQNRKGVAIKGYDPVAYFAEQKPVKGNRRIGYTWQGARWYFSSLENRTRFSESPERFAPQYGGYCAWAVGRNYLAPIDPKAWKIVDDKLYLNYSRSIRSVWLENVAENIRKADANWPGVLDR